MSLRIPKSKKGRPHKAQQHAPQQEKRIAEYIGGRVVRGSGRGNEKGDARLCGVIRIENKCTAKIRPNKPKDGFKITVEMVEKIESAALQCSEVPAIQVEFIDEETGKILHTWALVPTYLLKDIAQHYIESAI